MDAPPLVLVPVNRLERAKGRLAGVLSEGQRRALALATLRTVLAAAREAGFATVVLTSDEAVAGLAGAAGARVLTEAPGLAGLNAQLADALARLEPGDGGVLILHADLPLASAGALRALVAAAPPAPSATLVRSTDGGTNAMLLRPPGRFPLAYGPGSCDAHLRGARAAGVAAAVAAVPALSLDLDTPDDLAAFAADPRSAGTPAAAVLAAAHPPADGG